MHNDLTQTPSRLRALFYRTSLVGLTPPSNSSPLHRFRTPLIYPRGVYVVIDETKMVEFPPR